MTQPVIGVLGLQGDIAEHRRVLESLGVKTRLVRSPQELVGLDGIVIPGGESTTMSNLALKLGVTEPLRQAIRAGLPAFGTCAGMIMLAERVLDGRADQEQFGGIEMDVRRNAFGRQIDSFEADIQVSGFGVKPYRAVLIRAPWVERFGAGVEVLARLAEERVPSPNGGRIVAVRQKSVLAVSFHPELTPDTRFHSMFLSMVG